MKKLINSVLKSARNYSLFDFACLKIYLVFAGILLGSYFSNYFLSNILVVWVICIVTFIYVLYITLMKN